MSSHNRLWRLGLVASTLVLLGLIFTDWVPYLRGPAPETSEWYWPYLLRPFSRWWVSILAALGLLGVAAWWFRQPQEGRRATTATSLALAGLVGGSLLLQLGLIYADRATVTAELLDRTLSHLASGFFTTAVEIDDLNHTLRHYPQEMATFGSEHARTHPPGLIIANRLTANAFAAAPALSQTIAHRVWPQRCTDLWLLNRSPAVAAALATWSLLPLLAGALAMLPAYALARHLLATPAARLAAVLVASLPSLLLFAPKSVQLYAPLTLLILLTFHLGLARHSLRWFFLCGLLFSLSTFLSLGNAALLLVLAIYALLSQRQAIAPTPRSLRAASAPRSRPFSPLPWPTAITGAAVFLMGATALWLLYWVGWGVAPWRVVQTGLQQHYQLVTLHRRYSWWVISNVVDLFLYAGWPLMVGFVAALLAAIKGARRGTPDSVQIVVIATAVLILTLDLSGSTRGETGRLWLFLMPLVAVGSAAFYARALPGPRTAILLVALQLATAVSLGMAWQPVRAVIVVAQRPSMPPGTTPANRLDISFVEPGRPTPSFTLSGFTLEPQRPTPGDELLLTLYWQAEKAAWRPYTVFRHLLDANGQLVAQKDSWPAGGQWPPTCWRANEQIVDQARIALPDTLPAGKYLLSIGMYEAPDGQRLPTVAGEDSISLTTVTVFPPDN